MIDSDSTETDTTRVSRRKTLKVMGAGTGAAALLGGGSFVLNTETVTETLTGEETWRQHQYDAAHTGHAPTTGPRIDIAIKWKNQPPREHYNIFQSGPVVANGMVYASNWDVKTLAWDAETGELQWVFPKGYHSRSPTVFDDTVYFVNGNKGDERLYALDAMAGKVRWRKQKIEGPGPNGGSAVTVANGTLYYGTRNTTFALDPETGEVLWTADLGTLNCPAVTNGTLFGVQKSEGGTLFALDAETGEELWSQQTGMIPWAPPTVADGTVYMGRRKRLLAYDAQTGEEAFDGSQFFHTNRENEEKKDVYDYMEPSPAVVDGTLYVGSNSELFAVDAETGETLWKHSHDTGFAGAYGSPAVVDEIVYAGDLNGRMWGFDADTGEVRFHSRISDGILNSPAVANGNIYTVSEMVAWGPHNNHDVKNILTMFALEDPTK